MFKKIFLLFITLCFINISMAQYENLGRPNLDDPESQLIMGEMFYYGSEGIKQDAKGAIYWFTKSAEQGNVNAQFHLGRMNYLGDGLEINYFEASKWLLLAAQQDHTKAQFLLGSMYYKGWGLRQDFQKALSWLSKAARKNHARANSVLGIMYQSGQGVKQNLPKAKEYYGQACDLKLQIGCELYAKIK